MRVAVRHTDKRHPNHGWFAYEQGRILGFTHPLSGESLTPEQVAGGLLERAKAAYPQEDGYEHRIETLHATGVDGDGHEVSGWFPAGKSKLPLAGSGGVVEQVLEVSQDQEESAA